MQEVIRDGALRLLTSEATCDVILNCQGRRLVAHKVILSIASPLLQDLLLADQNETSVLVLPDISANIMVHILDYIYTGSVLLHTTVLSEFLSVANLLKLKVQYNTSLPTDPQSKNNNSVQNLSNKFYSDKLSPNFVTTTRSETIYPKNLLNYEYNNRTNISDCNIECCNNVNPIYPRPFENVNDKLCDYVVTKKQLKFTPIILQDERHSRPINGNKIQEENFKLCIDNNNTTLKTNEIQKSTIPLAVNSLNVANNNSNSSNSINNLPKKKIVRKIPNLMPITKSHFSAFKSKKGLYNKVFPSPWCPRIIPVTEDPRNEYRKPSTLLSTISDGGSEVSKENTEVFVEYNDSNNNSKRMPSTSPNLVINKQSTDNTALNLNISNYRTNPIINYHSNCNNRLTSPPLSNNIKNEENLNNNNNSNNTSLVIYEQASNLQVNEINNNRSPQPNNVTDYQNIKPVTSDSTYSSAESSNSSCDLKSGEDCVKISDEDNGKEDGELSDRKQKRYKCEDCGKQFSQLRNYKYHRSVHEGTKEFAAKCPECDKVFNDRGYLSSHLKIHRDRKEYGCPHCPKRFNQRVAYNMHLRIHTGVKPHVCPTCGKGFSRKMLLKQHQRVHTGERPYQCPECGKSFADRSNMSLHARLHTGIKPYACNLCPKSFTKKHHLKTHMNYHTGLKPYVCQKCGLTFSQSSNMRTHYKKCIQKDTTDVTSTVTVGK